MLTNDANRTALDFCKHESDGRLYLVVALLMPGKMGMASGEAFVGVDGQPVDTNYGRPGSTNYLIFQPASAMVRYVLVLARPGLGAQAAGAPAAGAPAAGAQAAGAPAAGAPARAAAPPPQRVYLPPPPPGQAIVPRPTFGEAWMGFFKRMYGDFDTGIPAAVGQSAIYQLWLMLPTNQKHQYRNGRVKMIVVSKRMASHVPLFTSDGFLAKNFRTMGNDIKKQYALRAIAETVKLGSGGFGKDAFADFIAQYGVKAGPSNNASSPAVLTSMSTGGASSSKGGVPRDIPDPTSDDDVPLRKSKLRKVGIGGASSSKGAVPQDIPDPTSDDDVPLRKSKPRKVGTGGASSSNGGVPRDIPDPTSGGDVPLRKSKLIKVGIGGASSSNGGVPRDILDADSDEKGKRPQGYDSDDGMRLGVSKRDVAVSKATGVMLGMNFLFSEMCQDKTFKPDSRRKDGNVQNSDVMERWNSLSDTEKRHYANLEKNWLERRALEKARD